MSRRFPFSIPPYLSFFPSFNLQRSKEGRRKCTSVHSALVLLPEKSHGWRSLVGYNPWGRKESDTTEPLHWVSNVFNFFSLIVFLNQQFHIELIVIKVQGQHTRSSQLYSLFQMYRNDNLLLSKKP